MTSQYEESKRLIDELEERQDEVLRQLEELDQRIVEVLAWAARPTSELRQAYDALPQRRAA